MKGIFIFVLTMASLACVPDCLWVSIVPVEPEISPIFHPVSPNQLIAQARAEALGLPLADKLVDPVDTMVLNYGYHTESTAIADPFTGKKRVHLAIDIDCDDGELVYSPVDGEVIKVSHDEQSGHYVIIAFAGSDGRSYAFMLAHLNYVGVRVGDLVYAGQPIVLGGDTGRSKGAHIHLELRRLIIDANGDWYCQERLNPTEYFFGPGGKSAFADKFIAV